MKIKEEITPDIIALKNGAKISEEAILPIIMALDILVKGECAGGKPHSNLVLMELKKLADDPVYIIFNKEIIFSLQKLSLIRGGKILSEDVRNVVSSSLSYYEGEIHYIDPEIDPLGAGIIGDYFNISDISWPKEGGNILGENVLDVASSSLSYHEGGIHYTDPEVDPVGAKIIGTYFNTFDISWPKE